MKSNYNNQQDVFTSEEFRKNFKKNKKTQAEANLQVQVCQYIKKKYPNVIFMCDLASGMNLGKKVGGMNTRLRSSRGLPDLFIAKHVFKKGHVEEASEDFISTKFIFINSRTPIRYNGLFLELKKEGVTIWLQNGEMTANKHIREQFEIIKRLREQGYAAYFAIGYDDAVRIIDDYLR